MYSRAFGNTIESDGQLRNIERRYEEATEAPVIHPMNEDDQPKTRGFDLKQKLKSISIEDMLLIGIGLLLLFDGEPDNDILLIAIVFLLFF